MTAHDLVGLAERVEKATGPSRELDFEIALAIGFTLRSPTALERLIEKREWVKPDGSRTSWREGDPHFPVCCTGSLDAAMTLANDPILLKFGGPSGLIREAMDRLSQKFALHMRHWPADQDYPSWLARFIVAASLRARASVGEG